MGKVGSPLTIENIETGDLLFFRGKEWISWLIQRRTTSVFSHVGIAVRLQDDGGHLWLLESDLGVGVQLVPIEEWHQCNATIDWYALEPAMVWPVLHISETLREIIKKNAFKYRNHGYASWFQIARSWGFITPLLAKCFHWGRDTNEKLMHCTEYAATVYKDSGLPISTAPAATSPGELSLLHYMQRRGTIMRDGRISVN